MGLVPASSATLIDSPAVVITPYVESYLDEATDLMVDVLAENYITRVEIQMGIADGVEAPSQNAHKIIRDKILSLSRDPVGYVAMASVEGRFAGVALARIEGEERPFGDFWDVAVKPQFRNKGVGKKLIKKVHNFFEKRGIRTIYLDVNPKNAEAISLYKRLGYEVTSFVMMKKTRGSKEGG